MDQNLMGSNLEMHTGKINSSDPKIKNSIDVYKITKKEFGNMNYEKFIILYLDKDNKLIYNKIISQENSIKTKVHSYEIFEKAYNINAKSIILIHNHPSGNLNPSKKDIQTTKNIKQICKFLNLNLYDHLILNENTYFSFYDHRIL